MNPKFIKALYLLDWGKYEKAEESLKTAINECDSTAELERYSQALVLAEHIIENSEAAENYDLYRELKTAKVIENNIKNMCSKGEF